MQTCLALIAISLFLTLAVSAQAELPPLIPRKVLFGNPVKTAPQLSPDGTRLGYIAESEKGVANVWVQTPGKDDARMVTQDTRRGIYGFEWAEDGQHILFQQDSDGDENWHLFSLDLQTSLVRDLTPFQGIRAQNLITTGKRPDEVLIGLNIRDRRTFDMYRIHLKTGAVTLDTENPGDVLTWTTDAHLVIRAATVFDNECRTIVRVRDSQKAPWRDLLVSPFEESSFYGQANSSTIVVGFTADGKGLYVVSPLGSDTTRLVLLDTKTGKEKQVVASDPNSDVDYFWGVNLTPALVTDPNSGRVQAVGFNYLKPEWKVVDPAVQEDFAALAKTQPGTFTILSRDEKDTRWLVVFQPDDGPQTYYLYDRAAKHAERLFVDQPELVKVTLAKRQPVVIKSRDGLNLVSYLTLPPGVPAKGLPLILIPHGGPWYRDRWGFDPEAQLFANRGYAVLHVNFRASAGFGMKHLNAGNGQFGNGAVLRDLLDGVQWAIDQGIADPKRIAIIGGSFGGYATLLGITFAPERFACAVDIVGPSQLRTLFQSMPAYWKPIKQRWIRRMGDVEHDDALNKRLSPLFHVANIRAPLLIGHGANDPRVKLAESEKIVQAMRARNLAVQFIVYPDEGHGFARPENNLDFYGRVEAFFAHHLGGRAEPWQKIEGSTAQER